MESVNLVMVVVPLLSLLFSLCLHEAAHAAMANMCGDDTARLQGRLSLNPIVHADPIGTVVLPLILVVSGSPFLFGWAKPVPFNPSKLKNFRRDPVLIAMAGPLSNLLLALLIAFVMRFATMTVGLDAFSDEVLYFLQYLIFINLLLLIFNLIPVPPLDGHYVLNYFLPPNAQAMMRRIGPMGILIAILVARPLIGAVLPKMMGFINLIIGI